MLPRARFDGDSGHLGLQLADGSTPTSGKPARPCRPTWCENYVWSSQRVRDLQFLYSSQNCSLPHPINIFGQIYSFLNVYKCLQTFLNRLPFSLWAFVNEN